MSTKVEEVKLDIEEFNNLLEKACRQRTKDVLMLEIRRLQTELAKLLEENKDVSVKPPTAASNATQKRYEVKLNNYGWDQTNTIVKIYITLKDVHQLPKESIICNFTDKSLDLRVLALDNRNYHLPINNLCAEIDTEKSNVKVKTDMIVVSLVKKIPKDWSHVTWVEKRIKEAKTPSMPDIGEGDPGTSLMNLMKKMYQDGDDDMKKTIAKAWTESQQKNAAAGGLMDL